MIKTISTILIFAIVLGYMASRVRLYLNQTPQIMPTPSTAATITLLQIEDFPLIETSSGQFRYLYTKITHPERLELYPNVPNPLASEVVARNKNCSLVINGGFYNQEYLPIGWLVSEGKEISPPVASDLLNANISQTNTQHITISHSRPRVLPKWGLQSGPLLLEAGQPIPLTIKNDEPRRRLIVALDHENTIYFVAILGKSGLFEGSPLADTAKVLKQISDRENLGLVSALNLDGGSASTFYQEHVHLQELSPVGNYFCLRR